MKPIQLSPDTSFCKFRHVYLNLQADIHRVQGPHSQVSESLVLRIPSADATSLPTRGPIILFCRWKSRVWANIWTTMWGSTRSHWATGRHYVICHPGALLQLSKLQANFYWDFAHGIYKTILLLFPLQHFPSRKQGRLLLQSKAENVNRAAHSRIHSCVHSATDRSRAVLGAGDAAHGDSGRFQPQPHSAGQKHKSGQRTGRGRKNVARLGKKKPTGRKMEVL